MKVLKFLVIIAGIIALIILSQYVGNTILFSPKPENERTISHSDFLILTPISDSQKHAVEPLINEFFGSSATVVLSIKAKDFNKAEKSLQDLETASNSFENIVVNLDLNGTDIETFRNENKKSIEDLKSLYQDSSEFENLKKLSLNVDNSSDPQTVYSVSYQGKAIRDRVKNSYERFKQGYQDLSEVSSNLNISNTEFNNTNNEFSAIVNDIDESYQEEESRANDLLFSSKEKLSLDSLTLSISPNEGNYGDMLVFSGSMHGKGEVGNRSVDLIVDSRYLQNVTTDDHGNYYFDYVVDLINPGSHLAFSEYQSLASNISFFSIKKLDTEIILNAEKNYEGNISIYGNLLAGQTPVIDVPITLKINRKNFSLLYTDEKGFFHTNESFKPGKIIISAEFSNTSFPLSPSKSREITIISGKSDKNIGDQIIGFISINKLQILIVLLIFFIIVFVFIFRKKWIASKENKLKPEFSQKTINPITDKALPENKPEQVKVEEKNKIDELKVPELQIIKEETDKKKREHFRDIDTIEMHMKLYESLVKNEPRDAVHHLLSALLLNITDSDKVEKLFYLTPRELIWFLARRYNSDAVILFIDVYENLRYGRDGNLIDLVLLDSLYYLFVSGELSN